MEPDLCRLVKMDPNVKDAPPPPPPRPADAMPKDRLPTPEEVAKIIENHPELHKPLFFANHQKKFIAFTWLTIIGKDKKHVQTCDVVSLHAHLVSRVDHTQHADNLLHLGGNLIEFLFPYSRTNPLGFLCFD